MEQHERDHITSNLSKLITLTTCNTSCTSYLIEKRVLSADDKAKLNSIENEREKTEKLYEIVLTKEGSYPHLISALDEGLQSGALAILHNLEENADGTSLSVEGKIDTRPSKRRKRDKVPILFDVLAPVLNFTGREPQLFELHRKLQENVEKRAVISQMASIVGLGGIGKTELARKYIQEYGEEFYDGNAVWISAQTEETLSESFRRLASNHLNISLINVDKKEMDIGTIVGKVYAYYNRQRVLFVFDNAESTDHLSKFLPFHQSSTSANTPYILITSREWRFSVQVLELDEMTEEEAITFVKTSLGIDNDDNNEEILRLVNRLQRYPLALSQAVSFIKQRQLLRNFSIGEYLDKFEENSAKLLDSKKPAAEFNSYRETTFTTWRVTTQQIASDEENGRCAMEMLNTISYFLPDKIPMSIFANLSGEDEYQDALDLLVKYSMLNVQREEKTVSVHRLVQEVGRIQLKKMNMEEQALRNALQLVSCSIEDELHEELLYHVVSVYKVSCALNPELSAEFKHLPWKIVEHFNDDYRYEESETVGKELENLLSKIVPPEDPDLLKLKLRLVWISGDRDENRLESHLEAMEKFRKTYVENKENSQNELLSVEPYLSLHLKKLGRFKEAVQLSRKIFEQQKTLYELNHWRTIDTLVDLAECFCGLETADNSTSLSDEERKELSFTISIINDAHQTNLELVGKNLQWTERIVRLAYLLHEIRDSDEAINILNVVIKRTTESLDKRFLRMEIGCMILLVQIKEEKEECDELLVICQSLYSKMVSWKGKTDEMTLKVQGWISNAFLKLGELEKAVQTYTDILKILEKKRELPHPDRPLEIHVEIVNFLRKMEKSQENLNRLGILKAKMETEFGESHPLLSAVKFQIAS